ncbi:sensor histidine kinase [Aliarcobacter thereius]|uniref:histidine kinase n=2 Tax=Aliarcobacter thereius TaxID=544718 RepID=A0A1C0B846_9BACT|nr:HAMP domain-containing sensor histidine kinase [Aliarcobacter thereius]OCL93948.1 Sensor protein BasS [Aliarcobacter thereius]OCL95343.1 Sensor protein BasS [Aliarcobacter thereius LMG 24486]OCL99764.1 Sensor protein BasS [Aliarcobacter thereius]QBF16668.1 two-component system sensor histidine kinase [Aliarcobacter thereius LMG 24486]TLS73133.1 HAMP domain-containing histidine kinase [Aliarcobacter thereius]
MKSRSIYKQFYLKLIIATSLFILTLSFLFFEYSRSSFYNNISESLLVQAKNIEEKYKITNIIEENTNPFYSIRLVNNILSLNVYSYSRIHKDEKDFVKIDYPLNQNLLLEIRKDITLEKDLLYTIILKNYLSLAIPIFILMLIYSLFVSKNLLKPIVEINKKLSNMDENSLSQIDTKNLPTEFLTLANSINSLTNRIGTYLRFKKELYIGIAHELKTPLAVMKLKNELMLRKPREKDAYIDTINLTINEINSMNIMISSILDIGRTEGAQFEQAKNIELVSYINKKVEDYKMLASQKDINMRFVTNVSTLNISIQETLFMQILQNFVQNAIKFTPNEKSIEIGLKKIDNHINIYVLDEGLGVDESVDVFAPFKKIGKENGVGLGLYLAQIASDALNAKISLKNRDDGKSGAIAKLELHNNKEDEIF